MGKPHALPLVPDRTEGDVFENAIRRFGVANACAWFGHTYDSEFTLQTIEVLQHRGIEAAGYVA
jgi:hypothetical protein